jgi:hypothetical protein
VRTLPVLALFVVWGLLVQGCVACSTGDWGFRRDLGRAWSVSWWARPAGLGGITLGVAGPIAGLAGLAPTRELDLPALRGATGSRT